ncbi:MAG TPA: hypothetical protein VGK31_10285, partial [Thermoanaerobaculia bacterium]
YDPTPPAMRPGDAQSGLFNRYASALSDSINYFWDRYVLTYGLGDQIALLAEMIARLRQAALDTRHNATAFGRQLASPRVLSTLASIIAALAVAFLLARRKRAIFDLIAHRLRQLGIEVRATTTAEEALEMLRARDPEAAKMFEQVIALYEEEQFSSRQDRERLADIRRLLLARR